MDYPDLMMATAAGLVLIGLPTLLFVLGMM
jgi:hypothetical protein